MIDVLLASSLCVERGLYPAIDEPVRMPVGSSRHASANPEASVAEAADRIERPGPHLTMSAVSVARRSSTGFVTGAAQ